MKKSGTANEIVKPIVVLTVICLVVTALLAYVNLVTSPIISESEKEAAAQARMEVLSEADSFDVVDAELPFYLELCEHLAKKGCRAHALRKNARGAYWLRSRGLIGSTRTRARSAPAPRHYAER